MDFPYPLWYLFFCYLSFCSIISLVSLFFIVRFAHSKVRLPHNELIMLFLCAHSWFSCFYAFFLRPIIKYFTGKADQIVSRSVAAFLGRLASVLLFSAVLFFVCSISIFPAGNITEEIVSKGWHVVFLFFALGFFLFLAYGSSDVRGDQELGGLGGRPFSVYPYHSLCFGLFTASLFSVVCLASCRGLCGAMQIRSLVISFTCGVSIVLLPSTLYFRFALIASFIDGNTDMGRNINRMIEVFKNGFLILIVMFGGLLVMFGGLLAQYSIQEKSLSLLWMLSCGAIYSLANLAMTQLPVDWGILNFIIGAISDCALSLFGLRGFTWIVFVCCFILWLLPWMLNYVKIGYPPHQFQNDKGEPLTNKEPPHDSSHVRRRNNVVSG